MTEGFVGVAKEGLFPRSPLDFVLFWARSHGYRNVAQTDLLEVPCRRIEWRYLDAEEQAA